MRLYWTDKLLEKGYEVPAIVHPSAVVSPSAVLEPGCFADAESGGKYQYPDRTCGAGEQRGNRGSQFSSMCRSACRLGSVVKSDYTIESGCKSGGGEVIFSTRREEIEGVDSRSPEDAVPHLPSWAAVQVCEAIREGHINEDLCSLYAGADERIRCLCFAAHQY